MQHILCHTGESVIVTTWYCHTDATPCCKVFEKYLIEHKILAHKPLKFLTKQIYVCVKHQWFCQSKGHLWYILGSEIHV
jgi:hypothetical protein